MHAHYTFPELLQPVLLACLAVALGSAAVDVVRHRIAASIVLFVFWFLVSATYWLFSPWILRWLAPLQPQPMWVEFAPPTADPYSFPESWLLWMPSEFQDHWARIVVSPSVAAWHDVYLVALTLLAVAVAVPGRVRTRLALAGGPLSGGRDSRGRRPPWPQRRHHDDRCTQYRPCPVSPSSSRL